MVQERPQQSKSVNWRPPNHYRTLSVSANRGKSARQETPPGAAPPLPARDFACSAGHVNVENVGGRVQIPFARRPVFLGDVIGEPRLSFSAIIRAASSATLFCSAPDDWGRTPVCRGWSEVGSLDLVRHRSSSSRSPQESRSPSPAILSMTRLPRAASFRKPEAVIPPNGNASSAATASRSGARRSIVRGSCGAVRHCHVVTLSPRFGLSISPVLAGSWTNASPGPRRIPIPNSPTERSGRSSRKSVPSSFCLASGSWDKTIRLWDVTAGAETARLEIDAPIRCIAALRQSTTSSQCKRPMASPATRRPDGTPCRRRSAPWRSPTRPGRRRAAT